MINVIFPMFLLFLFNFNVQCCAVPSISKTVFQEDSKWSSVVGVWVGRGVGLYLFVLRFGLFNFMQCHWTSFHLVSWESELVFTL